MTGREESRVPLGSCVEEATRASASRKISRMSSVTPALGVPSALEDISPAGLAFCRLCSHHTMAPTARAKTSPIPPAKCCQESCISPLPSQECGERMDFGSIAAQQSLEDHEKQQSDEHAGKCADRQTPDPGVPL